MWKTKWKLAGAGLALLMAMAVLALSGCEQSGSLSSDSSLLDVTIDGAGSILDSLGTPSTGTSISALDWTAVVPGRVSLTAIEMSSMIVRAQVVDSASTLFGYTDVPDTVPMLDWANSFELERGGGVLWIQVFSANRDNVSLYAFNVHNRTPRLSDVSVDRHFVAGDAANAQFVRSRSAETLGIPGETLNSAISGRISVGTRELANTVHEGSTTNSVNISLGIAVDYEDDEFDLVVTQGDAVPDFAAPVDMYTFDFHSLNGGDWLNIRVRSDSLNATSFYRIEVVEVNDSFAFPSNTIRVNGVGVVLGNLGHNTLAGAANAAELIVVNLGGSLTPNVTIEASPASGTTIALAHTDDANDNLMGAFVAGNIISDFATSRIVAMQLTNALGERAFYRFRLGMGNTDTDLTVTFSGVDIPVGTPGTWTGGGATGVAGAFELSTDQADNFAVTASVSSGATYSFARVNGTAAPPAWPGDAWNTAGTQNSAMYGTRMYVRVEAEDRITTSIYAVNFTVNTPFPSVTSVSIGGVTSTALGTPAPIGFTAGFWIFPPTITWTGGAAGTLELTEVPGSLEVSAEASNAETVRFVRGAEATLLPAATNAGISWVASGADLFDDPESVDGSRVYVEVSNRFGMATAYAVDITVAE